MRGFAAKLSLLLLIVSLVVSVKAQSSAGNNKKPDEATRAHRRLIFKRGWMGELIDSEAADAGFGSFWAGSFEAGTVKLAFTDFKASDGVGLTVRHGTFRSPDEASRYLHWIIEKRATAILKQGPKLDKTGKVTGLRAEVKLAGTSSAVLWTDNEHFFMIISSSLSDALELEKTH